MIPAHLVDTNVHLRVAQPGSPGHDVASDCVHLLLEQGVGLVVALQNLVEFWAVATRPATARGGLGLTHSSARAELHQMASLFRLLPDPPSVYPTWPGLLDTAGALGVQAHDARLVATMLADNVTHVLTFNTADFARYPGITAVHPSSFRGQAATR